MSAWSRPYLHLVDPDGATRPWVLPRPLPAPAGASADPDVAATCCRDVLDLPAGSRLAVRWRAPGFANPRKATFTAATLAEGVALACDLTRAAEARGVGWVPSPAGRPLPAPAAAAAPDVPAASPAEPDPATLVPAGTVTDDGAHRSGPPSAPPVSAAAAVTPSGAQLLVHGVLDPADRARVSPTNLLLRAAAEGHLPLGATVADVIALVRAERWDGWTPDHRSNMDNVLAYVRHLLVYREPFEEDPPEVAAWKRARLAVPGVEEGESLHVAHLLVPDLADAIGLRRHTDRRVERLNDQALLRHEAAWMRYQRARAEQAAGTRRGRLPARPPETVALRAQPDSVSARTEELFATAVGMVLATAERHGLLIGPNPWRAFAPTGRPHVGYRRPRPLAVSARIVLPLGRLVDLADAIAGLGPTNPRTGRPNGDRFRALVLLAGTGGHRPSELAAAPPSSYQPGPEPSFAVGHSGGPVAPAANDGAGYHLADSLKDRDPGVIRRTGLPTPVAEAVETHIARGYPNGGHLFTSPAGAPLRLNNLTDTYWRPAVARVCGDSTVSQLRELEFRWLRKGAITWMLRAGLTVMEVAELVGHSPAVLLAHYAGVVADRRDHHLWTGWDDAWAWAVNERDLP